MSNNVLDIENRTELSNRLSALIRRHDFFQVPFRKILAYLASLLRQERHLCISIEEFVVRMHYHEDGVGMRRAVDVFTYRDLAVKLGITKETVDQAIQGLSTQGVLKISSSSDGQMTFQTTQLWHPRISISEHKAMNVI